jgi:sodium/potassium-transporting ATPase subunit alpha
VPPSLDLGDRPDERRTLSIHVTDSQQRPSPETAKRDAAKEIADLDWHILSKDEVSQRLSVNPKVGLDAEQAKRKLSQHGPNEVKPDKRNPIWKSVGGPTSCSVAYVAGGSSMSSEDSAL